MHHSGRQPAELAVFGNIFHLFFSVLRRRQIPIKICVKLSTQRPNVVFSVRRRVFIQSDAFAGNHFNKVATAATTAAATEASATASSDGRTAGIGIGNGIDGSGRNGSANVHTLNGHYVNIDSSGKCTSTVVERSRQSTWTNLWSIIQIPGIHTHKKGAKQTLMVNVFGVG